MDDLAESVAETTKKSADLASCRRLIEQLNATLSRPDAVRRAEPLSEAQKQFLTNDLTLTPRELTEVGRIEFTPLDAYYLDECFMLRDTARSLDVKQLPKVDQARFALDWVNRNVRIVPGAPILPVQFLLLRGYGSMIEKFYAFLALAQQLELDVCLLADPNGRAPDFGIWGVGVLDGENIHVFDPRLGLPVPLPDGKTATLKDLRSGPDAFKALNIDKANPYDVTPERAKATVALVTAPFCSLSPRMKLLESYLPAGGGRLTVDLQEKKARFQKAGIDAWLWNPPFAESFARVLPSFIPESEGGTDRSPPGKRRIDNYLFGSVPWDMLPQDLAEVPGEPGFKVRTAFAERMTIFNQPGRARDLVVRGQFSDATEQLVALQAQWKKQPVSQAELIKIAKDWSLGMKETVVELARAEKAAQTDSFAAPAVIAARERMDAFWKDARLIWMYMDSIASGPLLAESTYLLALAKQEESERLTHHPENPADKDAWTAAIEWWRTFLAKYPSSGAAVDARKNLAAALVASGRKTEAQVVYKQLQSSEAPKIERLGFAILAERCK